MLNIGNFDANEMCCACGGGSRVTLGTDGDSCSGDFPECGTGLVCEQQSTANSEGSFTICVRPILNYEGEMCGYIHEERGTEVRCAEGLTCMDTEDPADPSRIISMCTVFYGEGADGTWVGKDAMTGFWFSDETTNGSSGRWVSSDGEMRGHYSSNADGLTGVWRSEDGTLEGTWESDESDLTVKRDSTVYDTCIDLDIVSTPALTDGYGNTCEFYYAATAECGLMDTDDFKAESLCCACQGGQVETLGQLGEACGFD